MSNTDTTDLKSLPSTQEQGAMKLDMSQGETTVKLDEMGPLVVNTDGTLSRITNWHQLNEHGTILFTCHSNLRANPNINNNSERANLTNMVLKRNADRLAKLQDQQLNGNSV